MTAATVTRSAKKHWLLLAIIAGIAALAAWVYKFNNGLLGTYKIETDDHFVRRLYHEEVGRTTDPALGEYGTWVTALQNGTATRAATRLALRNYAATRRAGGATP